MATDQILLEQAYKKVVENKSEIDQLAKLTASDVDPHGEPMDLEFEEEIKPASNFIEIIDELSKSIPSDNLINRLKMFQRSEVQNLIGELNEIGEQDNKWFLKDNLIKALFVLKDYEF